MRYHEQILTQIRLRDRRLYLWLCGVLVVGADGEGDVMFKEYGYLFFEWAFVFVFIAATLFVPYIFLLGLWTFVVGLFT